MRRFPTLFGCEQGAGGRVVCVGAAYDRGSCADYVGASAAPRILRQVSAPEVSEARRSGLFDLARRTVIFGPDVLSDIGDIRYRSEQDEREYQELLSRTVGLLVKEGKRPLVLGGDHSITLYVLKGLAEAGRRLQVLQLDAHHDYEDIGVGDRPTHGTFVTHLVREDFVEQVLQLGVRGLSWGAPPPSERVRTIALEQLADSLLPDIPLYLSVDVDAFDPPLIGAVHFPEPQGLSLEDFDRIAATLAAAKIPLAGADWTEYVPALDTRNWLGGRAILRGLARTVELLGAADVR